MFSARQLSNALADLLNRERVAMAEFIIALANFDRERQWEQLGYANLFDYLRRELGLSAGAAFYRKTAASLVQRYPDLIEPLRDGRLCLTSLGEVAKVITPDNHAEIVPEFFRASRREAQVIAARLLPPEDAPQRTIISAVPSPGEPRARSTTAAPTSRDQLRIPAQDSDPALTLTLAVEAPSPTPPAAAAAAAATAGAAAGAGAAAAAARSPVTTTGASVAPVTAGYNEPGIGERNTPCQSAHGADPRDPRDRSARDDACSRPSSNPLPSTVEAVAAGLYRVHATVAAAFVKKLEAATIALSHSRAGAKVEEVLEAGLDLILQAHAKRNGLVEKPREKITPSRNASHIPAHVKREVFKRDKGCCQWPLENGGICGSRTRLEYDHIRPKGMGGPATIANTRLLCKAHNQVAARRGYGADFVKSAIAAAIRKRLERRAARAAAASPRPGGASTATTEPRDVGGGSRGKRNGRATRPATACRTTASPRFTFSTG